MVLCVRQQSKEAFSLVSFAGGCWLRLGVRLVGDVCEGGDKATMAGGGGLGALSPKEGRMRYDTIL